MKKMHITFLVFSFLFPLSISAHGIGDVYALPVPLEYYLLGAGIAVAFSFFIIAIFLNKNSNLNQQDKEVSTPLIKPIISAFKHIMVFLLLLSITTGMFGTQGSATNFTPTFFWIYFLFGFGILSMIIGNIWDKVNPWKAISEWMEFKNGSLQVSGIVGTILLLSLFWFELVSGQSFIPKTLGTLLLLYTVISIVMPKFYRNWYMNGDLFSVLFNFIGKLAHFRISDNQRSIIVLNESKKLSGAPAPWWMLGTASVLLAGASYDSLQETKIWFQWLVDLGFSSNLTLGGTLGIILAPLPFLLTYLLAVWIMKKLVGSEYSTWDLSKRFIWSLIPIAFGYILAHNFSLIIVTAPQMFALISDPFGFGWNLFGTASFSQTNLILGAKTVWFIEIGFIVLAHVVGVLYAHILALNIFKDSKAALKSQYPLVILMIGFTVLTLWLLSQPLVISMEELREQIDLVQTFREPPMPEPPINRTP